MRAPQSYTMDTRFSPWMLCHVCLSHEGHAVRKPVGGPRFWTSPTVCGNTITLDLFPSLNNWLHFFFFHRGELRHLKWHALWMWWRLRRLPIKAHWLQPRTYFLKCLSPVKTIIHEDDSKCGSAAWHKLLHYFKVFKVLFLFSFNQYFSGVLSWKRNIFSGMVTSRALTNNRRRLCPVLQSQTFVAVCLARAA